VVPVEPPPADLLVEPLVDAERDVLLGDLWKLEHPRVELGFQPVGFPLDVVDLGFQLPGSLLCLLCRVVVPLGDQRADLPGDLVSLVA